LPFSRYWQSQGAANPSRVHKDPLGQQAHRVRKGPLVPPAHKVRKGHLDRPALRA